MEICKCFINFLWTNCIKKKPVKCCAPSRAVCFGTGFEKIKLNHEEDGLMRWDRDGSKALPGTDTMSVLER